MALPPDSFSRTLEVLGSAGKFEKLLPEVNLVTSRSTPWHGLKPCPDSQGSLTLKSKRKQFQLGSFDLGFRPDILTLGRPTSAC